MQLILSQVIIASFCYSQINPAWSPDLPIYGWWMFIATCGMVIVGEIMHMIENT